MIHRDSNFYLRSKRVYEDVSLLRCLADSMFDMSAAPGSWTPSPRGPSMLRDGDENGRFAQKNRTAAELSPDAFKRHQIAAVNLSATDGEPRFTALIRTIKGTAM